MEKRRKVEYVFRRVLLFFDKITYSFWPERTSPLSLPLFLPFYLPLSPKRASVVSLMRHKAPNAFLLLASSVDSFVVAFAASVMDSLPHCVLCWLKSHTYDKGLFLDSKVLAISRAVSEE